MRPGRGKLTQVSSCLVIQHVEPEGPYAIAVALSAAGLQLDLRRVDRGEPLPESLSGFAALVVMGGPMSAHDDVGFPSRRDELALIEDALRRELPVLGICLGAQLLAVAAGGASFPGSTGAEIGWAPVELSPEAAVDPLLSGLPEQLDVLHWHGDTFTLPAGSVRLAGSARYANQAFSVGPRAWGLQFHLEVDAVAVGAFLDNFGSEVTAAGADGGRIAADTPAALAALATSRDAVLNRFSALVTDCVAGVINLADDETAAVGS
jgi:GMP synthase-like glutamine amidotransferase